MGHRLGKTLHASPLRFKLRRLQKVYGAQRGDALENWLIRIANARGARVVIAPPREREETPVPVEAELSNEELVVAICQLNCLDRPQMLRLAAQLISRGELDRRTLIRLAVLERAEPVLAELSRQALKIAPDHPAWRAIHNRFGGTPPLHDALIHWTRLAEPVMERGKPNASSWRLVA